MSDGASAELKRLIVVATRAGAVIGLFDYHGHVSARDGDVIHVNGRQSGRIGLREDQVATVRLADGSTVGSVEVPSETNIHLSVYRARPEVGSVIHFHANVATAFATAGRPLVTAYNAGVIFGAVVPVFDDPALIQTVALGDALARALGQGRAVLMRGHGATVVGADVPDALMAGLFLEEGARRLAATIALGEPKAFTAEEIERGRRTIGGRSVVEKTWDDVIERARLAGVLDELD